MRIGILTGGGDCPGLNAVIRAVVRKGIADHGDEIVGFRDGWRGVLEGDTVAMDLTAVRVDAAPEVKEGDWLDLDYDLRAASAQSGLSQYELLTTLGSRFERVWT